MTTNEEIKHLISALEKKIDALTNDFEKHIVGDGDPKKGLNNRVTRIEARQSMHAWGLRSFWGAVIGGSIAALFRLVSGK